MKSCRSAAQHCHFALASLVWVSQKWDQFRWSGDLPLLSKSAWTSSKVTHSLTLVPVASSIQKLVMPCFPNAKGDSLSSRTQGIICYFLFLFSVSGHYQQWVKENTTKSSLNMEKNVFFHKTSWPVRTVPSISIIQWKTQVVFSLCSI